MPAKHHVLLALTVAAYCVSRPNSDRWQPDGHDLTVLLFGCDLPVGCGAQAAGSLATQASFAWDALQLAGYLPAGGQRYRPNGLAREGRAVLEAETLKAGRLLAALAALVAHLPVACPNRHLAYRWLAAERWQLVAAGQPVPAHLPARCAARDGSPANQARWQILLQAQAAAQTAYRAADELPATSQGGARDH